MVCAVAAAVLVPADAAVADGPAPTPGRRTGEQVRVERPHLASIHRPRLCITERAGEPTVCIGSKPRVGEELAMFGFEGHNALVATVVSTEPTTAHPCHSVNLWNTGFRVRRQGATTGATTFGFTGLGFDAADATMQIQPAVSPPPLRDQEEVFLGVDAASDGTVDHLLTSRPCEHSLPKGAPPGPGARCLAHWRPRDGGWTMIVEDVIYGCP